MNGSYILSLICRCVCVLVLIILICCCVKKRVIRIMPNREPTDSCRGVFRCHTFPTVFVIYLPKCIKVLFENHVYYNFFFMESSTSFRNFVITYRNTLTTEIDTIIFYIKFNFTLSNASPAF